MLYLEDKKLIKFTIGCECLKLKSEIALRVEI